MRACIYGAGAMGTVLGAFISRAGKEVQLITRNSQHVAALNSKGAHVVFASGGGFTQRVEAIVPQNMSGKYDVIFLMTKQRQNAQVVAFLIDYLAEGGVICTMQNGLPEYSVAQTAGENSTLGCAVSWGATYIAPGQVMLTSSPDAMTFSLGSPFGQNDKTQNVVPYLACAGRVETIQNFIGARWSKLIVNSAFSSLSAVTSLTFGQVARGRTSRRLAQLLLKEGIDTALANGVTPAPIQGHDMVKWLNYGGPLKRSLSYMLIPIAMKKHKNLVSGMYYDLAAGRQCEIDFVAGHVAQFARKVNIPTPATDAVLALCHEIENGKQSVSPDNISVLMLAYKTRAKA